MIDLEKTALHRVYRTEHLGDALVVALQGDSAGFSIGSVHNEMLTLVNLARHPEVRNLIIDMSGSNYYGSLILGEIVNLAQAIKEKGGRVALAGISPDMKEVLRMMKLDAMWERYPTRAMALRALGNLKWQDQYRPYFKPAAIGGGIVLLLAIFFLMPRKDHTPEYYRSVSKIWDDAKQMKRQNVSDMEWQAFNQKAKGKLAELSKRLKRIAGTSYPNLQYLLYVARDHAPPSLDKRLDPQFEETEKAEYYLVLVKSQLEHTDPPQKPKSLEINAVPMPPGAAPPPGPAGALPKAAATK